MVKSQENIKFSFVLEPRFWDMPPTIKILVDQDVMFNGVVDQPCQLIEFDATMLAGKHKLTIQRYGKTIDQTVNEKDQLLLIKQIEIDGINIQNIVWSSSLFYPEYPEPWASQQRAAGINLEYPVLGETFLGHNGSWEIEFTSPFYQFLINQIRITQ